MVEEVAAPGRGRGYGGDGAGGGGRGAGRGYGGGRGGRGYGRGYGGGEAEQPKAAAADPAASLSAGALTRHIVEASGRGLPALLAVLASEGADRFNVVHCCTALNRLARLAQAPANRAKLQEDEAFRRLLRRLAAVLPGCEARSASTAAHALASLGVGDEATLAAVGDAVRATCGSLDRQGLANVLWALAKLPRAARGDAPVKELTRAALECADDFTPQELANIVWALPQLSAKDQHLVQRLALVARHKIHKFTPQGLGMLALGFSSLGIFSEPLFAAISRAARAQAEECNVQDSAQILTAFAKFKIQDDALLEALCGGACRADWEQQGGECVTSFLWALGTMRCTEQARALLPPLLDRAASLAPALRTRHVVLALSGLAKVSAVAEELKVGKRLRRVAAVVAERVAELVERLDPQDLGLAAWALTLLGTPGRGAAIRGLCARAAGLRGGEQLSPWCVAHLEYAVRSEARDLRVKPEQLLQAFNGCTAAQEGSLRRKSDAFHAEPEAALIAAAPWGQLGSCDGKRALVVGRARALQKVLQQAGFEVSSWLRFSDGPRPGKPWPDAPGDASVCCLRYPGSTDALDFALHAAASVLRRGARLYVFGHVQEGVLGVRAAVAPLFKVKGKVFGTGDARILAAARTKKKPRQPLEAWLQRGSLDLGGPAGPRPWVTAPGLFAGGGLDVMTKLLLDRLSPALPAAARVLDFGAGSGALGAGLCERGAGGGAGRLELTLLDSDAAALEAARLNVPGARLVLADGLASLREECLGSFDAVVSNPPVHRGRPDDWRVLCHLIAGAADLLKPSGQLWLVAQEHVPVGRLLANARAADGGALYRTSLDFADGRFAVWRASLAGSAGEDEDEGEISAPPATGRQRRPKERRRRAEEGEALPPAKRRREAAAAEAGRADGESTGGAGARGAATPAASKTAKRSRKQAAKAAPAGRPKAKAKSRKAKTK